MTLQEENEKLRELLSEASDEIKMYAVQVDGEWGSCRTWEELVEQGEANDLALEIDDAISSNTVNK